MFLEILDQTICCRNKTEQFGSFNLVFGSTAKPNIWLATCIIFYTVINELQYIMMALIVKIMLLLLAVQHEYITIHNII